jgi:hypothetical protein
MPTLLGLMGHAEPYFAFGRDIFNEHADVPFAINYDNNAFQAITAQHLIRFDETRTTGVFDIHDVMHEHNLLPEVDVESVEQRVKAMIQSYYSRVQQKDYLVHDSLSDSTTER